MCSLHHDIGHMMPCTVSFPVPLQTQVLATPPTVKLTLPTTIAHVMPRQGATFLAIVQNDEALPLQLNVVFVQLLARILEDLFTESDGCLRNCGTVV